MGLDMYLNKVIYVGAKFAFRKVTGRVSISIEGVRVPITLKRIDSISEEVMYWRKANQIHKWFVDNVQHGNDDCGKYPVYREQLQELLDLCRKVYNDHSLAPELLPVQTGCFFGSDEYGEWYFEDIEATVKGLTKLLEEKSSCDIDYEYCASW